MGRRTALVDEVTERELSRVLKDGQVLPGFSGIGRLLGRQDYSPAEETVLNYFFTNTTSNIYAVRDEMPSEFWAVLMGQYARSNLTARDRLLKLFNDMHKKGSGSIEDFAKAIARGQEVREMMSAHIAFAGEFIDRYGVKYGHASLRDASFVRYCIEGISQRGTKRAEVAREAAYQEQSTRALELAEVGMPFELRQTKFEEPLNNLNRKTLQFKQKLNERLQKHIENTHLQVREEENARIMQATDSKGKPLSDREWKDAINSKAFDISRNATPQNAIASLGMTINTRRLQDVLTEWQSDPLVEMRVIGRVAQIEGMKVNPTLMKYGNKSAFYSELPDRRKDVYEKLIGKLSPSRNFGPMNIRSTLITSTPEINDYALASILYNADPSLSIRELVGRVQAMNHSEKQEIAKSELETKLSHELYPKTMEIGAFTFEREYDIGSYRDLQRQRGDRQQCSPYSVIGYHLPPEIEEVGLAEEYVALMNEVREFYDRLRDAGLDFVAEYIPLMGNMVRQTVTKDPVQ